jgi:hypothetical protein
MVYYGAFVLLATAAVFSNAQGMNCTTCFKDSAGAQVCVMGSEMNLDGSGKGVEALRPLNFGGDLTISAWVKNENTKINLGRVIDFGSNAEGPGDNILLANDATSGKMAYEVYYGSDQKAMNGIASRDDIPENMWVHVVVIQKGASASMWWDLGDGKGFSMQASGNVNPPNNTTRAHNFVGKSNWPNDSLFRGHIHDIVLWNTALDPNVEVPDIQPVSVCTDKGVSPIKCLPSTSNLLNLGCLPPPPPTPAPPPGTETLRIALVSNRRNTF